MTSRMIEDIAAISVDDLKRHYRVDEEELIRKGISVLKIAASIDNTEGELIARKNGREIKIKI